MKERKWFKKLSQMVLVCAPLLAMTTGTISATVASAEEAADAAVFEASQFPTWVEEEGTWRTVVNSDEEEGIPSGFIEDESGKPTQEDLEEILGLASLAPTSGGKTDWYLVAVTDPEEQLKIIGDNYGRATSEGTVTILVFSERLIRDELRTDVSEDEDAGNYAKFSPDRGYYNAGIVSGYLNLAAISKGYGTHFFMSPALPGTNGFDDGSRGQDAYQYLEGTEYYDAQLQEHFSTENMKFVNAIVIGTPDSEIEAGVTMKEYPENWSVFEGTTEDAPESDTAEETDEAAAEEEVVEEEMTDEETATEDEETAELPEGTEVLTGEAEGMNGPVIVEVVMDGDTIISVEVIEHQESPGVADNALRDTPQDIVDNNGIEGVETVSGATISSEAIMDAVQNALDNR